MSPKGDAADHAVYADLESVIDSEDERGRSHRRCGDVLYPDGRMPQRWLRWSAVGVVVATALLAVTLPLLPSLYDDVVPVPGPLSLPERPLTLFYLVVCLPVLAGSALVIWVGTVVRLVRARPSEGIVRSLLEAAEFASASWTTRRWPWALSRSTMA